MAKIFSIVSALSAVLAGPILAQSPIAPPIAPRPTPTQFAPPAVVPAPIDPPVEPAPIPAGSAPAGVVAAPGAPIAPGVPAVDTAPQSNVLEFQGDEIGLVLRSLGLKANVSIVVSDKVQGTVTMRLVNTTPRDAIKVIVDSKGLVMTETNGLINVKTTEERAKEPAEPGHYTFSYAMAETITPLLDKQLASGQPSQFDKRTNTVFFHETHNAMERTQLFLQTVDRPTEQVMIEARLVEVNANPKQSYGINWAGVVGSASQAQTIRYGSLGGSSSSGSGAAGAATAPSFQDFIFSGASNSRSPLGLLAGQAAILSVPQLAVTMRFLNEDQDAEFLANPRIVTANNQKAQIKITRNQPVPNLTFNEQTAQAVFSGFQDKEFGNTLDVTPVINKDGFISLAVKPEISNKVGDMDFTFQGGQKVTSPIIDKRTLESNVLIKSGDTLAIGGLLQDEVTKGRNKVPVLGDIPGVGYLFTERTNSRIKRNLLIFVTPTILKQGYGSGLEEQASGLHSSGEEFADPNGWRNNAKGSVRLVPTSNRPVAADYPKPGIAPAPKKRGVKVVATAESN